MHIVADSSSNALTPGNLCLPVVWNMSWWWCTFWPDSVLVAPCSNTKYSKLNHTRSKTTYIFYTFNSVLEVNNAHNPRYMVTVCPTAHNTFYLKTNGTRCTPHFAMVHRYGPGLAPYLQWRDAMVCTQFSSVVWASFVWLQMLVTNLLLFWRELTWLSLRDTICRFDFRRFITQCIRLFDYATRIKHRTVIKALYKS